jgi:hypothetical protein
MARRAVDVGHLHEVHGSFAVAEGGAGVPDDACSFQGCFFGFHGTILGVPRGTLGFFRGAVPAASPFHIDKIYRLSNKQSTVMHRKAVEILCFFTCIPHVFHR